MIGCCKAEADIASGSSDMDKLKISRASKSGQFCAIVDRSLADRKVLSEHCNTSTLIRCPHNYNIKRKLHMKVYMYKEMYEASHLLGTHKLGSEMVFIAGE